MTMKADKVAGIIQKDVSEIIPITDVKLTNDKSIAKIYVSFLGQKAREEAGMRALERGKGFIRSHLAKRLSMRKVPDLIFLIDHALEKGNKIEDILRQINK